MTFDPADPFGVSAALALFGQALSFGAVVAVLLFLVRGRG